MTSPLQHGLVGNNAAVRRQMDADNAARRTADERSERENPERNEMAHKTKWGAAKKPPSIDKADSNLDTLGELLGDVADAIREATERDRVLDGANAVEPGRFAVLKEQ